ncbi:MAG: glycosyltransferase family 4 protein [Infirmifilum sp.]
MNYRGKVLVVSEIFWPEGGGAELATYLILKILRDSGYSVTVVTGTNKPMLIKNVKFHYTPLLGNYNRVRRWLGVYILSKSPWFIKLLRSHEIVYIPLHAYPLIPVAKKYGRKVIVHMHNYVACSYHGVKYYFEPLKPDVLDELRLGIWHEAHAQRSKVRTLIMPVSYSLYKLGKSWLEQADTIICVSKKQADVIRTRLPELSKKIAIIYNPLPEELINSNMVLEKRPSTTPTLLYGGGFSVIKGIYVLAKALKNLETHGKNQRQRLLITYGRIGEHQKLIEVLRTLNTTKVEILGRIPYEEVLKLHRIIWATLFPSIWEEPMPYAVLESALLGTIPIASRTGGIPEILEGTPAEKYMFTPGEAGELVEKIEDITSLSPEEIISVGAKLREDMLRRVHGWKIEKKLLRVFT